MGLEDLQIAHRTIPVGDSELQVRGISLIDLMNIVNVHAPEVSVLFSRVVNEGEKAQGDEEAMTLLAVQAISEFPEIVASVIAMACDAYTEKGIQVARRLPVDVQVAIIYAAFDLTFRSEGGIKKTVETLAEIMTSTSSAIQGLRKSPSPNGIGESDSGLPSS